LATLNFADVLSAPEFIDRALYVRTTSAINANGVAVDTASEPIPFFAVLLPGGSKMARLSDGSRLSGDLVIYSQTWLTNGIKQDDVNSTRADLVLWHGRKYTVTSVQDFDAFAGMGGGYIDFRAPVGGGPRGFFVATADLLPLNPTAGV
jgi:hypothetical protein